jgi:hypothetical protein
MSGNTPEGRIKRMVKTILKQYPRTYGEWPVPSGFGKSGLDYHGCSGGRYFAIETKAPGGKVTPRQALCIDQIRLAGGKVFVIDGPHCPDYQALIDWLEPHAGHSQQQT